MEPCFPGTLYMCQNPVLRWTTMIAQPQPLIEVFAEIPDFRRCRGKRHPLPAILSGLLCDVVWLSQLQRYCRMGAQLRHPYRACAGLYSQHTVCGDAAHGLAARGPRRRGIKSGAWAEGVVVSTPIAPSAGETAIALDGKTLRGSRKQGAPGVHLLSARPTTWATLAQQGVDDKTNEITQAGEDPSCTSSFCRAGYVRWTPY